MNGVHWENFHPPDSTTNLDYFTRLSTDWEKSMKSTFTNVRQVIIRTGIVSDIDNNI